MASTIGLHHGIHIDKQERSVLNCAPCLICGGQFLGINSEGGHGHNNIDNDTSLLQLLFKVFRMDTEQHGNVCKEEPADEDDEQEQYPFCDMCKDKLEMLLELQIKLEELEEQIKTAKQVLSKQLDNSEEIMQKRRIRHSEERCRIRRHILRKIMTNEGCANNNLNSNPSQLIDGEASSPTTRTYNLVAVGKSNQNLLDYLHLNKAYISSAFVKLSAADRECAELAKGKLLLRQHPVDPVIDMNEESNADLEDDDHFLSYSVFSVEPKKEPRKNTIKRGSTKKMTIAPKTLDTMRMKNEKYLLTGTRKSPRVKSSNPERNNCSETREFGSTSDCVSARTRKLLTQKTTGRQYSSAEDKVNSATELELEDADTNCEKGVNRRKPLVYHIDPATGNCTLLGITLEKLPKNERGQKRFCCTKCLRVVTVIGSSIKYSIRRHVSRVHPPQSDPKKQIYMHYIDRLTGNFTLLKVTLEKMPDNENGNEKTQYKCMECSEVIVVSKPGETRSLRNHVFEAHTDKLSCKECGKTLTSIGHVSQHMKIFHNPQFLPVPCPICGKPFKSKKSVEQHQLTHLNEEEKEELKQRAKGKSKYARWDRSQCEECGQICPKNGLERHRVRKHGTEEERATLRKKEKKKKLCPECGKYVTMLDSHIEHAHSPFPKYPCVHCEKRFKTSASLRGHVDDVHKKLHRFKCTICPKTFYMKGQFDNHMRVHLNIRPFKCELCPSSFTDKKHLVQHIKVHRNDGSK